jgi:hypothetical protein
MKTAVWELIEFIKDYKNQSNFNADLVINLLEKTLEKEKEQIIEAYLKGYIHYCPKLDSIEYYNETYNQNK